MNKVYAFIANGTEEVECLSVVDILRRAGVEVTLVSIEESATVVGSHGIVVTADRTFADCAFDDAAALFLPGGMPGTRRLAAHKGLSDLLVRAYGKGVRLAAICAAPSVLGGLGLLKDRRATCFPGFESELTGAHHVSDGVVTDGTVTTARGLGFAIDLGLELVALLDSPEKSAQVRKAIQHA